jgi:hypothetical protein
MTSVPHAFKPVGPTPITTSGVRSPNDLVKIPVAERHSAGTKLNAYLGDVAGSMLVQGSDLTVLGTDANTAIRQAQRMSLDTPTFLGLPVAVGIFAVGDSYLGARLVTNGNWLLSKPSQPAQYAALVDALKGVVVGTELFDMGITTAQITRPQVMPSLVEILQKMPRPV